MQKNIVKSIISASVASAVVLGSQLQIEQSKLVSPVLAQETTLFESASVPSRFTSTSNAYGFLTAPVSYQQQVPVQSLESITVALTPFDSPLRSTAILTQTADEQTEIEIMLYGERSAPIFAQLQLGTCSETQLPADSIIQLAEFDQAGRSLSVLPTDLAVLLTQTQPLSVALFQQSQQIACRQL